MFAEFRAGLILLASVAFLACIVGIFALSMVMMPDRWSERTRLASEGRSNKSKRLSAAV
ncbi:MAG: hypothetical protein HC938_08675 [Nitrospira sp.]|nr:hypothetical protein [Nitrospira sp.]